MKSVVLFVLCWSHGNPCHIPTPGASTLGGGNSHIPKNSKWLQENLTEMDSKAAEPHIPEVLRGAHALPDTGDLHQHAVGLLLSRMHDVQKSGSYSGDDKGTKEKEQSLHSQVSELSIENENLKAKVLAESERAGQAEE
ncbi:hypothetical protein HAX54_044372 [Datura stramonium]|uniref:Uncharacterized protein n=1 Tax=Datura stramonium TaxID=4076 RepID=A0ABS8W3Y4_DATST|nr:hypothetical protein [Datura stramonium]